MEHVDIPKYGIKLNGLSETDPYIEHIRAQRTIEPRLANFLFTNFSKQTENTFLDIGANIGLTSLIMSRLCNKSSIYAFEPGPKIFSLLESNLEKNKASSVTAVNAAVSDKRGNGCFIEDSAYGHLTFENSEANNATVYTVDGYVKDNNLEPIDFIKIDVEGFEPNVFGGLGSLKPIIFFEFNTWCLIAYGRHNPLEFLFHLLNIGWDLYEFTSDDQLSPCQTEDQALALTHRTMVYQGCVNDLVAVPKGREIITNLQCPPVNLHQKWYHTIYKPT